MVHLPSACPGSGHPRRAWFSPPAPDSHGLAPPPSIAGAASTLHTSYDSDSTSWVTGNAGGQSVTNSPPGLRPAPATPQAEDRASTLGSATATATATRRRRRRLRVRRRRRRDRATGAVAGGRWPLLQSLGRHPPWEADTKRKQPAELLACCRGAFLFPAVCYAASFSRAIPACRRSLLPFFLFKKSLLPFSKLVPLHVFTFHYRSH